MTSIAMPTADLARKKNIKPISPRQTWVQLCNKIGGFAFFPIAPAAIAGVICSNLVKDTSKPLNSSLVHTIAYFHPFTQLILPCLDLFLSLLSASLCRIQPFSFLLPLGFWNALNELKVLNLSDKMRDLKEKEKKANSKQDKKSINSQVEDTQAQINKVNSLLGLFTKVICINLLFPPTYIVRLANVAGDTPLGKDLATKPLTTEVKNFKQYFKLVAIDNSERERKAVTNAIKTVFTPSLWRGTLLGKNEKINQIIREKKYNALQAFGLKIVGGSLKTAMCLGIIFARYIAGILFVLSLPFLGLGALNQGSKSYTKNDEEKAKQHPIAKLIFDTADKFSGVGMWLNGIVPLMALTPSNIKSSGLGSTICTTIFGILSLGVGISDFFKLDPVIGRTFFYMSKGFTCLGSALSNLYRSSLKK